MIIDSHCHAGKSHGQKDPGIPPRPLASAANN